MLTNVVRRPICHAFSEPEQAGLTPRSEQMPLPSGKPNIVSIAAAVGLAHQNVRPPECRTPERRVVDG
jgi:hypothetical protein